MTKTKLKKCPVCGAVMWHFANESRCLECAAWEAQDEKERARVRTLAWAAYLRNTVNRCHWVKLPLWLMLWA